MRYWLNLELGRTHVATTCTCKLKRRRQFKEYEKIFKNVLKVLKLTILSQQHFLFIINNVYISDHKFDAVTFRYCALGVSLNKQLFMEQWTVNDVSVSVSYFDNHQI